MTGFWYTLHFVDLWDRDGGEWSPNVAFPPGQIVGFLCTGGFAINSQKGGTFAGRLTVQGINGYSQYCPSGPQVAPGAIDSDGRITVRLPRRDLPDCIHVSGDSSVFTGTFNTHPASCTTCGDIVLQSTELATCTWRWTSFLEVKEHTFNAERRETLRLTFGPNVQVD
jgi:hypothetical protein